jgi:putative ABC transport system permease protein
MMMFPMIALRNLRQARRRTLLIGSALVMVTTLLVLLLALSQGLTDAMIESATTLSTGHVNVAGWFKSKPADAAPIVNNTAEIRKIVEENTPGLAYVIDRGRGWARLVSETGATWASLSGIDFAEEGRFFEKIQIASGEVKKLAEPNAMMIFESQAKTLGAKVGDQLTVTIETFSGARNTGDATIVAIAKDVGMMSAWNAYVPKAMIHTLYDLDDDTGGAVMVYLEDVDQSSAVMEHLSEVLEKRGYTLMEHDPQPFWMKFETVAGEDWVGQKLDVTTWNDEVSFFNNVLQTISGVSGMLIVILVVIIIIGIMNSMWISVRERTQEIGTLRAIGMSRWRVLVMFMTEALLLGLMTTAVGSLLGAAIAVALDAAAIHIPVEAVQAILLSDTLHMSVRPGQLVGAMTVFTLVTMFASFFPAWRASRLQPVTAIQSVT